MKQKNNRDGQNADDILSQLRAVYADSDPGEPKKKAPAEEDDWQDKLKDVLDQASEEVSDPGEKKKSRKKKHAGSAPVAPLPEREEAPEPISEPEVIAEPEEVVEAEEVAKPEPAPIAPEETPRDAESPVEPENPPAKKRTPARKSKPTPVRKKLSSKEPTEEAREPDSVPTPEETLPENAEPASPLPAEEEPAPAASAVPTAPETDAPDEPDEPIPEPEPIPAESEKPEKKPEAVEVIDLKKPQKPKGSEGVSIHVSPAGVPDFYRPKEADEPAKAEAPEKEEAPSPWKAPSVRRIEPVESSGPKVVAEHPQAPKPPRPKGKKSSPKAGSGSRGVPSRQPVTPVPEEDEKLNEVLEETFELPPEERIAEKPAEADDAPIFSGKASRNKKKKKGAAVPEQLSAVKARNGFSDDDIAMILELGYQNELGRVVGYENLKQMKNEYRARNTRKKTLEYQTSFGYRGLEYTAGTDKSAVLAAYAHDRKRLTLRVLLTAVFTVLLCFTDYPSALLPQPTVDAFGISFAVASLVFLTASVLLSLNQILAGWAALLRFAPTPYTLPAVVAPLSLIYGFGMLFAGTPYLHVGFLTSLILLFTAAGDVYRFSGEVRAFRLLSAAGPKTVLEPTEARRKKLRMGKKIIKIINDETDEEIYRVRRTASTEGCFRRFNAQDLGAKQTLILLCVSFTLAVIAGFSNAVYTSDPVSAFSAFMTVAFVTFPASAIYIAFYPLFCANRLLTKRKCALIGEESAAELGCDKTVIFRDTDLFRVRDYTNVSVREGDRVKRDMELAEILFRKIGGTLRSVGRRKAEETEDPPVSLVRITDYGAEAVIDQTYHLLIGCAEFLRRNGIRVPAEKSDAALSRAENESVIYVAVDGTLKLSYEVEYEIIPSFEGVIADLAERHCSVAISSYDPNINDAFLAGIRKDERDPVRVIKPGRYEDDRVQDTVDTAAVALGAPQDIIYPLYAASGIGEIRKFGFRIQLIASVLGAIAAGLLTVFQLTSFLGILPIAVYQLFWMTVCHMATRSELNEHTLRLKK